MGIDLILRSNFRLGLAITEVISETGISAIAHHHVFFWELHKLFR